LTYFIAKKPSSYHKPCPGYFFATEPLQIHQSLSDTARQLAPVDMAGGITKILEIATMIKALEEWNIIL
jgi:hypothetical protein